MHLFFFFQAEDGIRDLVRSRGLGDVYKRQEVGFTIVLTTPACPLRSQIENEAKAAVAAVPGVDQVHVRFDANVMTDRRIAGRLAIPVKNILAVGSGKGGVGKTTVAVNLAVALAQMGARVGILDADIYGPNVPMMMGVNAMPSPRNNKLVPPMAYGVEVMSMGFMMPAGEALIWRGPMLHSAIRQLFTDVNWGNLDYLVVDLPPGTGDAQLTLAQSVPLVGGVIVSTPQQVAVADATRGLAAFRKLEVPVLGIVENMSWFIPAETAAGRPLADIPEKEHQYIFGKGGARALSEELNVPFMAEVPLVQSIREAADVGRPAVLQGDTPAAQAFAPMLDAMQRILAELEVAPPKKKVADPADEMIVKP